ncbi:hypothetical protein [Paraburkholderia sp. SIMBA_054]|uniref:hypothetical protein n=1 Tax=Paraburkholderia sp. SIMBA_054 TaxID=3085795 RepID=UPI00397C3C3F
MQVRKGVVRRVFIFWFSSMFWAPVLAAIIWRLVLGASHFAHLGANTTNVRGIVVVLWLLVAVPLFVKYVFQRQPRQEPVSV